MGLTCMAEEKLYQNWLSSLQSMDPTFAASFPDQAAALAWIMQVSPGPPQVLGRARYAEDSLKKAVRQGVQQYVICPLFACCL